MPFSVDVTSILAQYPDLPVPQAVENLGGADWIYVSAGRNAGGAIQDRVDAAQVQRLVRDSATTIADSIAEPASEADKKRLAAFRRGDFDLEEEE